MKLWVYVVRRALLLIPVIVGVMTITFVILAQLPLDERLTAAYGFPKGGWHATVACSSLGLNQSGDCPNPPYVTAVHQLGLDKPVVTQWALFIENSLTLNWGTTDARSAASVAFGLQGQAVPVVTVLAWYLPYTLELGALALFFILILAIPLGNYSAVYRNRPLDQGTRVMSFSGFALPGFLLGILALVAVVQLSGGSSVTYCNGLSTTYEQWTGSWPNFICFPNQVYPSWIGHNLQSSPTGFPTVDALIHGDPALALDTIKRILIPAATIAFGAVAGILRFVRNSMLEVMNLDFVRTARAKGVPEGQVVRRHAGRNSLNVTVTVLGLTFAGFISGFPITEDIFKLHGIGLVLVDSIQPSYDFGLIFGATLLFTIIVVSANLIVDLLYAYLDPRVRLG